jgi:isopentenyl diphosphate isomerase/L-lactate dehydrogenase-like FMN-dependent dehydrogenase
MAGQFLKAAAISTENVVSVLNLSKRQIQVAMFVAGAGNIPAIQKISFRQE